MLTMLRTSAQTVGPFFHPCLLRADAECHTLVSADTAGQRIRIEGRVFDGDGLAVPDALVEIWQANAAGRYNHPDDMRDLPLDPQFTGFGRSGTDADGTFWFETVKPGVVPFDGHQFQAPHVSVALFARGLLNHVYTRMYFADDPAIADDPVLQLVPVERRATLLAQPDAREGVVVYRFDIVLQGAGETAFFNL